MFLLRCTANISQAFAITSRARLASQAAGSARFKARDETPQGEKNAKVGITLSSRSRSRRSISVASMDLMYPSITRESSAASVGVNSPFATAVVIAAIALVAPSTELIAGSKQQSWRSWLVGTLTEDMAALRYPRIGALKLIETIRHAFALRLGPGGGVPAW